jgi:hypothetical protein
MAAVDFFLKANDTLPVLYTTLTDTQGNPVDLTDATGVAFVMSPEATDDITVNAPAAIAGAPVAGNVQYEWAEGDTAIQGAYVASFIVSYLSGRQTYPSQDFINILIQPGVTGVPAVVSPFCSIADVQNITGQSVQDISLTVAWSVIEGVIGRPASELLISLDDNATFVLTTRDQYWLQKATAFQAAWVEANPDFWSAYDINNANQSGQSGTFNVDGLLVAPMARRALRYVTWMKVRSVKIQRPFPYARIINPTVNDNLGHPWNSM